MRAGGLVAIAALASALHAAEPGREIVTFPGDRPDCGGVAVTVAIAQAPMAVELRFVPAEGRPFAMVTPEDGEPGGVALAPEQLARPAGPIRYPEAVAGEPLRVIVPFALAAEPVAGVVNLQLDLGYGVPGERALFRRRIAVPVPVDWLVREVQAEP